MFSELKTIFTDNKIWSALVLFISISGCTGIPENIQPVSDFEINRYLGKWYEIGRLDHSFERGLSHVTAEYSLREDGGVKVLNRGYSVQNKEWNEAEGRAYFVEGPDKGYLKVSFFGPFYGSYIVFDLDENYQYSLVSGPDKTYLWILARQPALDQNIIDRLVTKAAGLGFETSELEFISHNPDVLK